jgi:PPM family protein phosphatase
MGRSYVHACAVASSRKRTEDRAEVLEHDDAIAVVLADGAGGMRGGGAASSGLVDAVRFAWMAQTLDASDMGHWQRVFEATDTQLAAAMAGETTGVLIVLCERGLFGISAGDSEVWIVNPTAIDDLTAGQSRLRLGSGRARPSGFFRPSLDGVLVVATDGLFKYASPDVIAQIVRSQRTAAAATSLVRAVRLPSGAYHDDVALVVVATQK